MVVWVVYSAPWFFTLTNNYIQYEAKVKYTIYSVKITTNRLFHGKINLYRVTLCSALIER